MKSVMEWVWANWQPWWDAAFIAALGGGGSLTWVGVRKARERK